MTRPSKERPRVVVVGATGFLGSAVCVGLDGDFDVIPVCRRTSDRWRLRSLGFAGRDPVPLDDLAIPSIDAVVIAAGGGSPQIASQSAMSAVSDELNLHSSIVQRLAFSQSPPAFITIGSRTQYGRLSSVPAREDVARRPQSLYALSKEYVERLYDLIAVQADVRSAHLILTNPYGPYEWTPGRPHGLVSLFLAQALEQGVITVYGDGTDLRDYIYIDDVVRAVKAAVTKVTNSGLAQRTINIGSAQGTTILQLAQLVSSAATQAGICDSVLIRHVDAPNSATALETGDFVADIQRAHGQLQWAPRIGLQDGLRRLIEEDWKRILLARDVRPTVPVALAD